MVLPGPPTRTSLGRAARPAQVRAVVRHAWHACTWRERPAIAARASAPAARPLDPQARTCRPAGVLTIVRRATRLAALAVRCCRLGGWNVRCSCSPCGIARHAGQAGSPREAEVDAPVAANPIQASTTLAADGARAGEYGLVLPSRVVGAG
jgi:hypothetical protein